MAYGTVSETYNYQWWYSKLRDTSLSDFQNFSSTGKVLGEVNRFRV